MEQFRLVLAREYLERIKGRAFIASTATLLVLVTLLPMLPGLLGLSVAGPVSVAVADETGRVWPGLAEALNDKLPDGRPRFHLEAVGRNGCSWCARRCARAGPTPSWSSVGGFLTAYPLNGKVPN